MSAKVHRLGRATQIAVRSAFAVLLFSQAVALLLQPEAFTRLGYGDGARRALALAECAAALLVLWPRTFAAGAVAMIATLAWAAGFHFGLHRGSSKLLFLMTLFALLLAGERAHARRRKAA